MFSCKCGNKRNDHIPRTVEQPPDSKWDQKSCTTLIENNSFGKINFSGVDTNTQPQVLILWHFHKNSLTFLSLSLSLSLFLSFHLSLSLYLPKKIRASSHVFASFTCVPFSTWELLLIMGTPTPSRRWSGYSQNFGSLTNQVNVSHYM